MKKRVILGILFTSFLFAANSVYSSVVVTNAMENPLMGYEVHGIGEKENEVAVVFTNENAGAISWTAPADLENVQFLVVGGGGGGGGDYGTDDGRYGGGGGGGGGVVEGTVVSIKKDAVVSVKVGAGGKGGVAGGKPGTNTYNYNGAAIKGGNSEFSIDGVQYVVADGGGRDLGVKYASKKYTLYQGGYGGSGAGSRHKITTQSNNTEGEIKVSADKATGTPYGNKGGAGVSTISYAAGGGGGATEEGKSPTDQNHGGDGGEGLASSITGEIVVYGSGGGGGTATSGGVGGKGGTGAGDGHIKGSRDGEDALANQGGGGGGSGGKSNGGNGGSGIVVLRYIAHTHEWSEWVTNKVATCMESGIRTRKCDLEDCTIKEFNEVIPPLGHNWGEWNVLREQDRATPGLREHTCVRCGEYEKTLFVTRPIRILTIGNSFSTLMCEKNALPKAAGLIGCYIDHAHLYKAGGKLSEVWANRETADVYSFKTAFTSEFSSEEYPFSGLTSKPKILDVIKAYDWDIVTLQQASVQSFKPDTYSPYLNNIINLIKTHAPNAKIVWQMTWSYGRFAKMTAHGVNFRGDVSRRDNMFNNILSAYKTHVKDVAWKTIPTGYAVQLYRYRLPVVEPQQDFTYTDYQHLTDEDATVGNTGGEYLQVLTWCKALFGEMPSYEAYPPSEYSAKYNISDKEEIMRLRQCASDACDATEYDYYGQGTVDFHWNVKFLNSDGSLISQQSITNGATAKVLKIFDDKSWSCKRRVRASGDGVSTETVTMTSENISTNKVYDTLTFTAKEAITDLGPQVGNEEDKYVSYDPEDAVNAARESKSIKYPSLPTLSGEVGSQVVTFGGVSAAVPSYYTASLDGNILSLKLNDAAKPTIDDEDESKAFEIKDGKVSIHLTNVKNKLYYSIISAETPNADDKDWDACGKYEAGKSDFEIDTNGEKRFYKASVKDEL